MGTSKAYAFFDCKGTEENLVARIIDAWRNANLSDTMKVQLINDYEPDPKIGLEIIASPVLISYSVKAVRSGKPVTITGAIPTYEFSVRRLKKPIELDEQLMMAARSTQVTGQCALRDDPKTAFEKYLQALETYAGHKIDKELLTKIHREDINDARMRDPFHKLVTLDPVPANQLQWIAVARDGSKVRIDEGPIHPPRSTTNMQVACALTCILSGVAEAEYTDDVFRSATFYRNSSKVYDRIL